MRYARDGRSLALAVALLALCAAPVAAQRGPLRGLNRYVEDALRAWKVPGLAIAVVKDDAVIVARGYGVRHLGDPAPVDERTLFAIGSASKAFTATAIAMLVDENKVKWDDRAAAHLPAFELFDPYATRELTVRDLLSHRSGLARGDLLWYGGAFSREQILQRVRFLEPSWSFRSRFGYQNIMFLAAGELVAAVSGTSWDDFVADRIFRPLGMTTSNTSVGALADRANVATPHAEVDGDVGPVPWRNIDNVAPAGSINSNVLEMAQWVRLNLGEGEYAGRRLVSSGAIQETKVPHTVIRTEGIWQALNPVSNFLTYGLGWFLMDYAGHKVVQHGGNIDGMSALVAMIPEQQLGVVILTNMNGSFLPTAVLYRVFDQLLERPTRDWSTEFLKTAAALKEQQEQARTKVEDARIPGTAPSLPLHAYAGTYSDSLYGDLRVDVDGERLVVRFGSAFVGDLEHWHYDTFRALWRDRLLGKTLVRFALDNEGKPSELAWDNVGDFRRAPAAGDTAVVALSEEQLRRFVGRFAAEAPPIVVRVELVGGSLKLTVPGQPTYTLVPLSAMRFRIGGAPPGFFVEFAADGGAVRAMTIEQPNITLTLPKQGG